MWAGEVVQWLRTFIDPAEDIDLIPSPHMVTHNHLKIHFQDPKPPSGHQCLLYSAVHVVHIYTYTRTHTHTQMKNIPTNKNELDIIFRQPRKMYRPRKQFNLLKLFLKIF